jgi:hypothetical protein
MIIITQYTRLRGFSRVAHTRTPLSPHNCSHTTSHRYRRAIASGRALPTSGHANTPGSRAATHPPPRLKRWHTRSPLSGRQEPPSPARAKRERPRSDTGGAGRAGEQPQPRPQPQPQPQPPGCAVATEVASLPPFCDCAWRASPGTGPGYVPFARCSSHFSI